MLLVAHAVHTPGRLVCGGLGSRGFRGFCPRVLIQLVLVNPLASARPANFSRPAESRHDFLAKGLPPLALLGGSWELIGL